MDEGTDYYLLFEGGLPVARCAIERYSEDKWEVFNVRCAKEHRGKGYITESVAYVTEMILKSGKTATCRTMPDNDLMLKVMEKEGYR